jgi:hypothetical protein
MGEHAAAATNKRERVKMVLPIHVLYMCHISAEAPGRQWQVSPRTHLTCMLVIVYSIASVGRVAVIRFKPNGKCSLERLAHACDRHVQSAASASPGQQ